MFGVDFTVSLTFPYDVFILRPGKFKDSNKFCRSLGIVSDNEFPGVGKLGGSVGVEGIRVILLSNFACMNREWGVK